jgi:hypothetical protein
VTPTSFLDLARDLRTDATAKAAFAEDPDTFLAARGFAALSPEDLTDAVGFVADTLPAPVAAGLAESDATGIEALTPLAELDLPAEPAGESLDDLLTDPGGDLLADGGVAAVGGAAGGEEPAADGDLDDHGPSVDPAPWEALEPDVEPGSDPWTDPEGADGVSAPGDLGSDVEDPLDGLV